MPISWKHLRTDADLNTAIANSFDRTVVLFKHSTRCPVSSMALKFLEQGWMHPTEDVEAWFLDLIAYRAISNRIAQELAIEHASPQMIVVQKGIAVLDRSHNEINAQLVESM